MTTPATFRVIPKTKWIVGRVVDIDMSKGGITLATTEIKNVTYFLLVDEVGPGVVNAKVGEIIVYKVMNHIFTRDGQRKSVVLDEGDNIIGTVEGLDPSKITIAGEKPKELPSTVSAVQ